MTNYLRYTYLSDPTRVSDDAGGSKCMLQPDCCDQTDVSSSYCQTPQTRPRLGARYRAALRRLETGRPADVAMETPINAISGWLVDRGGLRSALLCSAGSIRRLLGAALPSPPPSPPSPLPRLSLTLLRPLSMVCFSGCLPHVAYKRLRRCLKRIFCPSFKRLVNFMGR